MIPHLAPDSFADFIASNDIVLIDFFATWCAPCQRILKILPGLAADVDSFAKIGKVDVDQSESLKTEFNITKIPTFVYFKHGKEVGRDHGVVRLAELKAKLETLRNQTG